MAKMDAVKKGHSGKNVSEMKDLHKVMGSRSSKNAEADDKPARTPKEKNTGTSAAKRLAGKVIS